MSVHWSSETIKWEYSELQAGAMSVDFTGNNVLLAGRRWLAIKQINLDDEPGPGDIIKKFSRQSKYDAAGAEWCQTYQGQKLCAISSNQRVDVYEYRNGNDLTCISSLRGHTRVVSDTHFHRQDHNMIATCSIDTFTHIWDLRDVRKPTISLSGVAGASQVQWNKVAPHLVATAHDGDIKIWDYRKNNAPLHYISAHLCKIHGVDWSPHHEYQLVTSSHDGSIKYFDINNARRPENTIMTNFPVWRAIYTPFGSGLLTIGVGWGGLPRVEQAGVIGIWVGGTLTHRLVGHTDTVQTMVWRPNTSPSNYQLMTWGRDQTLRIWAMHPTLLKMCSHYLPDDEVEEEHSDSTSYASTASSVNGAESSQDMQMSKISQKSLTTSIDEEFDSIREMANIEVTDMNIETRTCQIHSERNGYVAHLQVTFPKNVIEQTIPKFSWISNTNIDSMTTIKILQAINRTAYKKKKEGQRCLLHCLKTLATSIDEIPVKRTDDANSMRSNQRSQSESENAGDACVPFPRTSGAKWCSVDTLVVFNRPANARRLSLKQEHGTPRSMSSLTTLPGAFPSGYTSVSPHATTTPSPTNTSAFGQLHHRHQANSITTFYFQDRWRAQGRRAGSIRNRNSVSIGLTHRVVLFDASVVFPIRRSLASKYIIRPHDPVEMCRVNGSAAAAEAASEGHGAGAGGLARAWELAGLAARALAADLQAAGAAPAARDDLVSWIYHPLGLELVQSLITHYAENADVQMAAMIACAFPSFNETANACEQSTISTSSMGNCTSAYSTVQQLSEVSAEAWTMPTIHRSSSCSEAENFLTDSTLTKCDPAGACMLDEATVHLYNCFKRIYADILHRWQFIYVRAEVMKAVRGGGGGAAEANVGAGGGEAEAACALCGVRVRGVLVACPQCRHAHHLQHAAAWFSQNEYCPSGCGCKCLLDNNSVWKSVNFA